MIEPPYVGSYNQLHDPAAAKMKVKSPRDPLSRAFYLPRLPREYYQGDAVVHWTLTTFDRAQGWLTPAFHQQFRELMFHAAAREGLACPVYCLMPDHLHLIWMGLRLDTHQRNGMAFLRTQLEPALKPAKFQPQAQDNVLRAEERKRSAFAKACFYVAANPVRAQLIGEKQVWPYTGCVIPGYPSLCPTPENFWPMFWKIYLKLRAPDAGSIKRPAF
jgi:REP element-mobilizing transposase RayT